MTIQLTPEQEAIVKDELKAGHFRTAEEVISRALSVLRESSQSSTDIRNDDKRREAVREMQNFAEMNRTSLQGVSVKELIHEGHRL